MSLRHQSLTESERARALVTCYMALYYGGRCRFGVGGCFKAIILFVLRTLLRFIGLLCSDGVGCTNIFGFLMDTCFLQWSFRCPRSGRTVVPGEAGLNFFFTLTNVAIQFNNGCNRCM